MRLKRKLQKKVQRQGQLYGMALHMSCFMPITHEMIKQYIDIEYPQYKVTEFRKFYNKAVRAGKQRDSQTINDMTSKMLGVLGIEQKIFVEE